MTAPWSGSTRRHRLPPNWPAIRAATLNRDHHTCQLRYPGCTTRATHADHITPGDNHHPSNLQAACPHCHNTKSAREGNRAATAARQPRTRQPEPHPGLTA